MYDFCLSFPYGALLVVGGMMGYLTRGSSASLAMGVAFGGLILLFGRASLHFYKQGRLCKPATMASMLVASAVGMVMYHRWDKTGIFFPGGMGALISGTMTMFYMWSFFLGPLPKVKPVEESKAGAKATGKPAKGKKAK